MSIKICALSHFLMQTLAGLVVILNVVIAVIWSCCFSAAVRFVPIIILLAGDNNGAAWRWWLLVPN